MTKSFKTETDWYQLLKSNPAIWMELNSCSFSASLCKSVRITEKKHLTFAKDFTWM